MGLQSFIITFSYLMSFNWLVYLPKGNFVYHRWGYLINLSTIVLSLLIRCFLQLHLKYILNKCYFFRGWRGPWPPPWTSRQYGAILSRTVWSILQVQFMVNIILQTTNSLSIASYSLENKIHYKILFWCISKPNFA